MSKTFDALNEENQRHQKAAASLIADLKRHILTLPDNPRINRLAGSPRAFTMKASDLGKSWLPRYHDFKTQYEMVVKRLESGTPSQVVNRLKEMVTMGMILTPGVIGKGLNLHPDVVDRLRYIANMPPLNCPNCHGDRDWDGAEANKVKIICHFCGMTT
jgi:hypothetical protein